MKRDDSDGLRISALRPRAGGHRVSVMVGGKSVGVIAAERVTAMKLAVGRPWSAELAAKVEQAAAEDKAYRAALSRLDRRAMSSRRLADKLRQAGHERAACDAAIERLQHAGLLDDEALGLAVIREAIRSKPAGPRLLVSKLIQRGIPGELARRLVREATDADSGYDAVAEATRFARQRARAMARLDPVTRKRRLWGALMRRGFDADVIDTAVRALGGDVEDDAV